MKDTMRIGRHRPPFQRMTFRGSFYRSLVWLPLCFLMITTAGSIPLLGNRFNTTTNVTGILDLAKDIAAMRDSNSKTEKLNIYMKGLNARDDRGNLISLASLSINATSLMAQDPLYNIFRYAFLILGNETEKEPWGQFDGKPVEEYANTIVLDLFQLNLTDIESEAALAMNVWMSTAHELYDLQRACSSKTTGYQAVMNSTLDRMAAFWIGADQVTGDNTKGNSLYNLAERVGEQFGQHNKEVTVNTNIVTLLNVMQGDIAQGICSTEAGYIQTRNNVKWMIGNMTIPLVQELVIHIFEVESEGSSDFAELFTLSFLPRVLVCDPTAYDSMMAILVLQTLVPSNQGEALAALQNVYSCLGITCADVGSYQNGVASQCFQVFNASNPLPLASYVPSTDLSIKSYIDRDILQVRVFMDTQAYVAAEDYVKYGYNSDLSLQQLYYAAIGQNTPIVTLFREYYNTTGDNVINVVLDAINKISPFDQASEGQRTEIVLGLLRFVVMQVSFVAQLESALSHCQANATAAAQFWDYGAAYYIGSIEGSQAGGEADGELLYAAAKEFCTPFETCTGGDANANLAVLDALQQGKQSLVGGSCQQASFVFSSYVITQLPVILLQGLLWFASLNAELDAKTQDGSLGEGYALSIAVLPLVEPASKTSADTISSNMAFQLTAKPVNGNASAIFEAVRTALPNMLNMTIECVNVGIFNTTNETVCPPVSAPSASLAPAGSPVMAPQLAFGRYTFVNASAVAGYADFAFDVKEMYYAKSVGEAMIVYNKGKYATAEGLDGKVGVQSLASLSTQAALYMGQDPIFNFYRYALLKEVEYQPGVDPRNSSFADIVVQQALNVSDVKLAAEVAVTMNIFSLMTHKLNQAVTDCGNGSNRPDLIDAVVALWIGQEQMEAQYNSGWMFYSIAQRAWYSYGNANGEAQVNSRLMELFKDAQQLASSCSNSASSFLNLRIAATRIVQLLSLPLIQNLLLYISEQDLKRVELYALSVIPQAAAIAPAAFNFLDDHLYDATFINTFMSNTTMKEKFLDSLAAFAVGMRYSCDDFDATQDTTVNLTSIVDALCENIQLRDAQLDLAGYQPVSNVAEQARIDLDILQIRILLLTGANKAAKLFYEYGQNSFSDQGTLRSLQQLATSNFRRVANPQYGLFTQYFNATNYADDIVVNALIGDGPYAQASRAQQTELVVMTLQTMISYMEISWRLASAVAKCKASLQGVYDLDSAVALYVGSIESSMASFDSSVGGQLIYSLASEMCSYFDTCTTSGDASINEVLISAFNDTKTHLQGNDCDLANTTLINYVFPSLPVPMIQGALYYSYVNAEIKKFNTEGSLASGFILADSVLPLVNASLPASATTIQRNMAFNPSAVPVPDGSSTVFDAFASALNGMGIGCEGVGALILENKRSVCQNITAAPQYNPPTDNTTSAYFFTTYVQDVANIALDVRDMSELLNLGRTNIALEIYANGKNSDIYDTKGIAVGLRSLSGLSTNASHYMLQEPTFNFFRYALQDGNGQFMGKDVMFYADTIVQALLSSSKPGLQKLSVEAVVILNVWMYLAHQLYQTLEDCKNKAITGSNGVKAIDVAVAYWMGDGQVTGSPGHLLYGIAEQKGKDFRIVQGGQSITNRNILRLFNEAKYQLSFPNACSSNPNTYPSLFRIVNEIVPQMTIPLIQGLIESLRNNDRDRSKLYAQAFVPMVAACSPSVFDYLNQMVILSTYNVVQVSEIISQIRSTFICFGITCEDVGVFSSGPKDSCIDTPTTEALAGYIPSTDVRKFAQVDLDILEMDILMQMEAYEAAQNIYTYGKHATTSGAPGSAVLSLSQLATTSGRTVVPQFDSYVRYFSDDTKYADSIVQTGFNFNSIQAASNGQRRELILATCQYMILHMAALQAMYDAIGDCEAGQTLSNGQNLTGTSWDEAAAFLIGSLEGSTVNGSSDGRLIFALANYQCDEFATCSAPGYSSLNDRIISLLYTGRGAYIGASCSALLKATKELQAIVLVPLIQGALSASIQLHQVGRATSSSLLSDGYVLSSSVLPLVDDTNRGAASTISKNLALNFNSEPVPDGVAAIFAAFSQAYSGIGVDCRLVGVAYGISACTAEFAGSNGAINIGLVVGLPVAVVGFALLVWLLFFAKRKIEKKELPESAPIFVTSNGVFNHGDTELLNGEHYDASPAGDDEMGDHESFEDADLIPVHESDLKIV